MHSLETFWSTHSTANRCKREEAEKFLEQSAIDMESASAGTPEIPGRIWKKFCEVEFIAKDLSEK